MNKNPEKPVASAEQNDDVRERVEKLADFSLEKIAEIDRETDQTLQEIELSEKGTDNHDQQAEIQKIKNAAQRAKEAIFYYIRIIILGGLVLNLGGEKPKDLHQKEGQYERLVRAKAELKVDGVTSEQRRAYKLLLSSALYRGVNPVNYETRIKIENFIPNLLLGREIWDAKREDAWRIYLGLPQQHGTFEISDYKPSHGKEDKYYYKIAGFWESYFANREVFEPYSLVTESHKIHARGTSTGTPSEVIKEIVETIKSGKGYPEQDDTTLIMGRFKIDAGEDQQGFYISYYDKWNLNISLEREGFIGKPFEIYDRLYYDSATFEPLNLNREKLKQEIERNEEAKQKAGSDLPG